MGTGIGILTRTGPVAAAWIGFGAGGVAGGLLAHALARVAERPGVGRAAGVSFLPRAALLLMAFLWARSLQQSSAVWIVPGYLTGEAVWVVHAVRHLRRAASPDARKSTPAEE